MALNAQQIQQLIDALQARHQLSMTSCKATFDGSNELYKVEAFINEVTIFKTTERISDADALQGLPLLFKKEAAVWWEGIRTTVANWNEAIAAIRNAYAPPLKNYQLYTKIIESKQTENETTEKYVCRQRALMSRLKQNHDEITQIDFIYGGILQYIRKDMPRTSITIFTELLTRAKIIEEHHTETKSKFQFCDHCKMRNHSTKDCTRKHKTGPSDNASDTVKSVVKCYGCGKEGFVRSNCPDCKATVQAASIDLEFSHITLTLESPIPTIPCHINGLSESASFDTAAKTSIASENLYQRLLVRGCKFISQIANIKQADGKIKQDTVKLIQGTIEIQTRMFKINLVVLSDTDNNRTLLGIDFLEQAGIIISPIQRGWWFINDPKSTFSYDKVKNFATHGNINPMKINTTGIISKSKKRRMRQQFKNKNIENSHEIKTTFEAKSEFEFKKPEMLPQVNWSKPKEIKFSSNQPKQWADECCSDDDQTQQCESILELIHSKYMTPNKPISPIKTPPKKTQKASKIKQKLADLFGSDSDSSLECPRTPGRDSDSDILDINIIEIQYEPSLPVAQEIELNQLVQKYADIFNETGPPCPITTHKINTGNQLPISSPPYRMSQTKRESMKQELDTMLEQDVIEESESPWAFQVVMIPKKDGSTRFCVDYRKLNAITVKDSFPLPRIDDLLQEARSTKFMSSIDLKSGYWQIPMQEDDKEKTAFVTPFGSYQFKRMPFGLCNAPATFQRLMNQFRNGLPSILILIYLDDIIIISKTFNEHLDDLGKVFKRLQQFQLRANPSKCKFACGSIKYLGHILTSEGINLDPTKISAIIEREAPRNVKEILSFIQTCSWYRKFIPDFAKISQPLTRLTRKNVYWQWTEIEQESFVRLKQALTTAPVLGQLDDSSPLTIKTDASGYAIGAVLIQGLNDNEHPIEYASRLLTPAERNYSTIEREALAVVWALEKFQGYIDDKEITLITDHQPLKWLMSIKSPSGRLARWALRIQAFNINIQYTPGRTNTVADTLSRPPQSEVQEETIEEFSINIIQVDFPHHTAKELRSQQMLDEELKSLENFTHQQFLQLLAKNDPLKKELFPRHLNVYEETKGGM